jgi:hypothetical protein
MLRHSTDFVSLAFGLLFAVIGVVLAVERLDAISLTWIVPVTAIVLGLVLVVAAGSSRPSPEGDPSEADEA